MTAPTLQVIYDMACTVVVTNNGAYTSSGDNTWTINGLNDSNSGVALTASSSVPVTKVASGTLTLSSGTGTLDLTALPDDNTNTNIDFTGLKVQVLILRNKSTNANKVTVAKGGSNGYSTEAGNATITIPISPAQAVMLLGKEVSQDVDSSHKNLDVTGTGSQVLEYLVVGG